MGLYCPVFLGDSFITENPKDPYEGNQDFNGKYVFFGRGSND